MQSRWLVPARATTARIWKGWSLTRDSQKHNLSPPQVPVEEAHISTGPARDQIPGYGVRFTDSSSLGRMVAKTANVPCVVGWEAPGQG